MSFRLTAAAIQIDGTPSMKLVMVVLADMADDSGKCWPSIETIAKRSAFTERAVVTQIKKLQEAGFLKVTRNWKSNCYQLRISGEHRSVDCDEIESSHEPISVDQMNDVPLSHEPASSDQVNDVPTNLSYESIRESIKENQSSAPDLKPAASSPVAAPSLLLEAEASATEKPAKKPRKSKPIPDKPESLDQVTEYGQTLDPPLPDLESQKFMHYWKGEDWRSRRGPMKDWKHSLRTWHLNWQTYGKTDAPSRPSKPSRTVTTPDGQTYRNVRSQFSNPRSSY